VTNNPLTHGRAPLATAGCPESGAKTESAPRADSTDRPDNKAGSIIRRESTLSPSSVVVLAASGAVQR
jgi:hypothetical protein